MKKGFILLEVLVASAVSSFILAMITTVVYQVNSSYTRMSKISSTEMRALLVQNQMDRDLVGAFIPQMRQKKKSPSKEGAQKEQTIPTSKGGENQKGKQPAATKSGQQKKEQKQFEDVPLKNAFLSKNKDNNLEVLTCITTNPISIYETEKPRIARVVYRVLPDKVRTKEPPSFRLVRQEAMKLDFGAFGANAKDIRSYEVIKNIKRVTVEYTVMVKKEEKKPEEKSAIQKNASQRTQQSIAPKAQAKGREEPEYKKFSQWTEEEIKKTNKQKPDFCVFTFELWDDLKRTSDDFTFSVYMLQGEQKAAGKKKEGPKKSTTGEQKNEGQKRPAGGSRPVASRVGSTPKKFGT